MQKFGATKFEAIYVSSVGYTLNTKPHFTQYQLINPYFARIPLYTRKKKGRKNFVINCSSLAAEKKNREVL